MSDIPYGQWTGTGAQEYATGEEAFCTGKVFYISGLTVTKRKTTIRAQGGTVHRNMAVPCTTNSTLAMSVIFKGESNLWPSLFNKQYTIPVTNYPYNPGIVTNNSLKHYTFYVPNTTVSYISPDRKFFFSLGNIGVCLPKEFFDISISRADAEGEEPKTYWDFPHVTSDNLQYLEGTKKTPATFSFKSFEWNSGYSYNYESLSRAFKTSYQNPFYYIGMIKSPEMQTHFDEDCLGIFPSVTFLASDYCYEIEDGSLYFRNMTLVPSDPELSDIIGIESISCKLTNSL